VVLERDDVRYRFVDTAGIRRKGRTERGPEVLSVVMARRHLERADICLVLVDADDGITRQDAHVGGYAWEAGRAVALVVNKWDLVSDRATARAVIEDQMVQVGTSDLNRILHEAWQKNPPSVEGRREPKLFYCSQVRRSPPHFILFTNLSRAPHFSYLRYLENALRHTVNLDGVPIRVMIKVRTR
jgi:GTP-binding protein